MDRGYAIGWGTFGSGKGLGSSRMVQLLVGIALLASTLVVELPIHAHAATSVPVVYAVTPNSGPTQGGTSVTVYGVGFTGTFQVKFGNSLANCSGGFFFVVSDTQIFVLSPSNPAGTVDVVVTSPGGSSSTGPSDKFRYVDPTTPVVFGISPNSGTTAGGTSVTINGSGLATATAVVFGTTTQTAFGSSDTILFVVSPPGPSGTVDVTVINPAGSSATSNADKFTYVAPGGPGVQGVSPNHGTSAGSARVGIVGTGFTGATSVHFGGTTLGIGSFSVGGDNQIFVNSPPGPAASTVDVTVTARGVTSAPTSADRFSYVAAAAPVLNGLLVNRGPTTGGTLVELVGSGFTGATTVAFGANPGAGVSVFDDNHLIVTSPVGSVGTVDITVTTPVGTSSVGGADQFTYVALSTPIIFGVSPHSGITTGNTQVTIYGAGLVAGSTVHFGANPGTSVNAFDTSIYVLSPPGSAGTVDITVTNPAGTSATGNTDKFTYVPPGNPAVYSVNPNRGFAGGGASVQLSGTGLTGATAVHFGTVAAASIFVFSDTLLQVNSPAGTAGTTVDITVTTPVATSAVSNADHFSYFTPVAPTITAISPSNGPASGGTIVWITGTALSGASVHFGATLVGYQQIDDTVIKVMGSPPGTNGITVDITVVTPGGTSAITSADKFTYTAALIPAITSVGPATGTASGNTTVYITGTGFANASAVNFGATPATNYFVHIDGTVITATSPAGTASTTVDIRVVAPGGTSAITVNDQFTYSPAVTPPQPAISAVSPSSGPPGGGTSVYLTGSNFTGATQVSFGASPAGFIVSDDSLISATSPSGTARTTVDVRVTTAGGTSTTSSADKFTYGAAVAPAVTGISPATGPAGGGTTVYITGTGFTGLTGISFGAAAATSSFAISDTLAQATSPAGSGTVDIRVTTGAGTSATSASDQFVYGGPVPSGLQVNGVTPNSGPMSGGTSVEIHGMGFSGAAPVIKFGTAQALNWFVFGDTTINATSPPGSAGHVDITVTVGASTSATSSSDGFTYNAPVRPVVSGLLPNHGSPSGGTSVNIVGNGLTGATAVHFGSVNASGFFVGGDTQIFATSPAGTVGLVDVTVTGPAGTSATSGADLFNYVVPAAPALYAVEPASGTSLGGVSIILWGKNLTGASGVAFGTTPAITMGVVNDNEMFVTSPAGTAGTTVDITVMTVGGTSATTNADKYGFTTPPVPVVNAVTPNRGGTNGGNQISLHGSGFSGATSAHFGTTLATNIGSSDDFMKVTSPMGALGTVDVTVTAPGGVSAPGAGDKFTYYAAPAPSITAVAPNTGSGGTVVYLTGTGLADVTSVFFGSTCVQSFFPVPFNGSDTSLSVGAPAGPVGTVDITVVSPEGTSSITVNDQFSYTPSPVPSVTAVAPASGPSAGGTQVFITGSGLAGVTGVTFGSTPARAPTSSVAQAPAIGAFFPIDDGLIEVQSPAGANGTAVDIRVTTPGGTSVTSSADVFTWGPTVAPTVSVVSPSSGPSAGGSDVLITGSGFADVTQLGFGTTVLTPCFFGRGVGPFATPTFGGSPAVRQPIRLPSMRVPVPIRLPIHQSATGKGTATTPAFATVLIPSEPRAWNTAVTSPSARGAQAPQAIAGPPCPLLMSDNLIDLSSPAQGTNPATVDVTVTSAGGTSATGPGDRYTYTATPTPAVSAVAPGTGRSAGGATVYISGSNLTNPTAVHFGSVAATIVTAPCFVGFRFGCIFGLSGDSLIQVVSPRGTNPSTVDVTVTTAGGTSAISTADQYTYGPTPPPTVGAVSPGSGPIGSVVFITGTGLNGATAVNFGGTPAVPNQRSAPTAVPAAGTSGFAVQSDNLISAISPTHALGMVDVTVVTAGGTSATSANDKYVYTASATPAVTSIGPNAGPPGTTVYITGTALTGASAVAFGTTSTTTFAIFSDALIRATTPSCSGTVDITVTTPGGTSATSANDVFSCGIPPPSPTVTSVVPNTGPDAGGTSVTITGTNFTGATAVKFGAAPAATFTVNSATTIAATSPAGTGTVDVTVTTGVGTSPIGVADRFNFGTPSAPTGPRAIAGDGEATLTWTPVPSASPITGYTVTASPGGAMTTVSAVVPAATVTGLTNGTPYTFTVAATNAIGTGPASLPSTAVTPTAVAQGPSVAVLPAMSNLGYGGYLTTAYFQNLGASAAHIRVQYFDTTGTAVGFGNAAAGLVAGGTWTLRTDNGHSLGAAQPGSAIVYSDQPLAVFVNEFAPGNSSDATSYTAIAVPSGTASTLYAPAIANNAYGGYTTGIGLVNLSASAVNITVTYRDGTGAVAKTQTLSSVAGGAYVPLYSGDAALGLPNPFAGTATITSSGGNLAAVVNETGPGKQFSSYDAVPAGSTTLYAPVALNNAFGGYNTGMGIQNTTGSAGTVTINYYDASGTPTTTTFPIVANGYLGVYQGTDIPVAGAYTAKLTSTVAIAAIVNEVAPSGTAAKQSTAYNTFAAGSSSLHLPLVGSAGPDGWSTGEGIMNTGTAATTVTVTYFDTATGLQIGTPQSLALQPNAFWGVYQPVNGLPNGMRASAVVTTTAGGQVAVICNESNATSFMSYTAQ